LKGQDIVDTIPSKNLIFLKQNPASESIQLIYDFPAGSTAKMELLSISGQLMGTYSLNTEQHQFGIEAHNLSQGLYILNVKTNQQFTKTIKVNVIHE